MLYPRLYDYDYKVYFKYQKLEKSSKINKNRHIYVNVDNIIPTKLTKHLLK